jgi:uncharacterized coiled-coil DUF342 family protein
VSLQEKTNQIETLRQQIASLKNQIEKADEEIKSQIQKRDQLNEITKKANQEINEKRTQRDQINEQVKLLKQQRDEIRAKIKPFMDQINELDDKKAQLKKKTPKIPQHQLQKELDAIEWKIQTSSLDLKEEKALIDQVKQLEIQLSSYKKIEKLNKKIYELLTERKKLETQADTFHRQVSELAKQSQDLHESMIAKIEEAKNARTEANAQHKGYIENKDHIKQWLVENAILTGQMMGLQNAVREQSRTARQIEDLQRAQQRDRFEQQKNKKMHEEQALKEKLGAVAREKLQRGEKLSWNEFQLLDDDKAEDADTQA